MLVAFAPERESLFCELWFAQYGGESYTQNTPIFGTGVRTSPSPLFGVLALRQFGSLVEQLLKLN